MGPNDTALITYRSMVSEVQVTFFATDETNRAIHDVTQDDFAIVDGDLIVRKFRSLARSEEKAVRVFFLVDSSESVATRLPEIKQQILGILAQGQLSAIDISVISFSGLLPVLLCHSDCQTPSAIQRLTSLAASGPTPLFDAIVYSANLLAEHSVDVRTVLLLFSDGDDTVSRLSVSDALQSLADTGVLLYAIDMDRSGISGGGAILRQMAEATGGLYFPPHQKALALLPSILDDLRASWVVTYQLPETTSGFHSLRILPKHNLSLRFHCRSGYFYGVNAP